MQYIEQSSQSQQQVAFGNRVRKKVATTKLGESHRKKGFCLFLQELQMQVFHNKF